MMLITAYMKLSYIIDHDALKILSAARTGAYQDPTPRQLMDLISTATGLHWTLMGRVLVIGPPARIAVLSEDR